MDKNRFTAIGLAAAAGLGLAVWLAAGSPPSLPAAAAVLWIPALAAWLAWRRRGQDAAAAADATSSGPALALTAGLGLFLVLGAFSGTSGLLYYWLPGPGVPFFRSGAVRFALLAAAFLALGLWPRARRPAWIVAAILLASQVACVAYLGRETGWLALYRDDHPSFMFRLWAFAQSFPSLVFYDPFWNGGRAETVIVSTGATGPGLLLWPLWRWFATHEVYTGAVAFVFIVLAPALAGLGARLAGGRRIATVVAALLMLACSRTLFQWALHFGTFGACFASVMAAPLAGALVRALTSDRPGLRLGFALVPCAFLFLTWPVSSIMALPLALGLLASHRAWTWPRWRFLLVCGAVVAVTCLPFFATLIGHGKTTSVLAAQDHRIAWGADILRGLAGLRGELGSAHPAIVFLGLAGLWFDSNRTRRSFFGVATVGLMFLTGWGDMWKPQLQLTRAAVPLVCVAVLPAAIWIERLLEDARPALAPLRAGLLALLSVAGHEVARIWDNRAGADYVVYRGEIVDFAQWIRTHTQPDARILFAGPTVHGFGRGHLAYLPVLTGRAMMACDYYHFSPKAVEYDYPPRAFRKDDEDVFRFLDLYNVGHVVTFHDNWKKFIAKHPEWFERVASFGPDGKRAVYRVKRDHGWFTGGPGGAVVPRVNALDVTPRDPLAADVLKFNWVPGMTAPPPVTIAPHDAGGGVSLIAVEPHGAQHFTLHCTPPLWLRAEGPDD